MYLRVAVQTTPTLQDRGTVPASDLGCRCLARQQRLNGSMRRMAGLAKIRRPHLEHAFRSGAMRVMAVRAVVIDRFVAMHERPTLFHVAGVTGFNHAITLHELRTHRTMHIVAIGASHFSLNNRVVRRLVDLGTLFLVAGKAHLGLRAFIAHLILSAMHRMTRGTGYLTRVMRTANPVRTLRIFIMATEASSIALSDGSDGFLAEGAIRFHLAGLFHVTFAVAMTSHAKWCAAIGRRTMFGLADRQDLFVIAMAICAFFVGGKCGPPYASDEGT